MAKITYLGESETVEWHGQTFERGAAVTSDNAALIAAAGRNPLFEISGRRAGPPVSAEGEESADKATAGGAKARAAGKPRKVPPVYHGKPEAERWLAGYDADPPSGDSEE
jgi:hypothetical protein